MPLRNIDSGCALNASKKLKSCDRSIQPFHNVLVRSRPAISAIRRKTLNKLPIQDCAIQAEDSFGRWSGELLRRVSLCQRARFTALSTQSVVGNVVCFCVHCTRTRCCPLGRYALVPFNFGVLFLSAIFEQRRTASSPVPPPCR